MIISMDGLKMVNDKDWSRYTVRGLYINNKIKAKDRYEGTELEKHGAMCDKMFDDIKFGERLYVRFEWSVSEDELDNTDMVDRALGDKQYVRMSLLTDSIIDYDTGMFFIDNRTELLNNYRPYFVSFLVPIEGEWKESKWKEKHKNAIRDIGDGWHVGRFTRSLPGSPESPASEGTWELRGTLETSASPVNYLDGKLLVFKDEVLDQTTLDRINKAYDPKSFVLTSDTIIREILVDAWGRDLPYTIDIYNVGHGNADYLRSLTRRILYDVGYNYRCFPSYCDSKFLKAVTAIRHMKPNCVILSHWDMDHIIGCSYAEKDLFSIKWIAPSLVSDKDKTATPNSIRLAHYLQAKGNLYLVDRNPPPRLIATISCKRNVEIRLWLGGGTGKLTAKNREGLMLEIIDSNGEFPHILLAGDVPYKCMPNILNVPIDFMHVTHHCSKMELDRLKSMPDGGTCAVISTNRKDNMTINYDKTHRIELGNKFRYVVNTIDNPLRDDEANLSIQINCETRDCIIRQ